MNSIQPNILISDETKTYHEKLYRILLHNDDINDMIHVVRALLEVFKFKEQEAVSIMMEAHKNGIALCKLENFERAELRRDQLQSFSLTATIEPED